MKILFYLEPALEKGTPYFHYATLRHFILPQLVNISQENEVCLLANEAVVKKFSEEYHFDESFRFISIDPVHWMLGKSEISRSLHSLKQTHSTEDLFKIKEQIESQVDKKFIPDLIISWESPVPFLKKIYPKAKILYQTPGFFSRPPYPSTVSIRPTVLEPLSKAITSAKVATKEIEILEKWRKEEKKTLKDNSVIDKIMKKIRSEFSSTVLFPLQIDGYFTVDAVLEDNQNQLSVMLELLEQTPNDVAFIVTDYISKNIQSGVLKENTIDYLRKKFKNFIYQEEFTTIPCVSQYLVPQIDGVISISSSVGFQAAFWEKPLYCVGKSHISHYNSAKTYAKFCSQVLKKSQFNCDQIIINEIKYNHVHATMLREPNKVQEYLELLKELSQNNDSFTKRNISMKDLFAHRQLKEFFKVNKPFSLSNKSTTNNSVELNSAIEQHDIISFDIFDTLLMRPFESPKDLFSLMDERVKKITNKPWVDFRAERVAAEQLTFQKKLEEGYEEITVEEIYSQLREKIEISESESNEIMTLELSLEMKLLYPRQTVATAYERAIATGKRVIIVSDMYLPESFLKSLLEKNGFCDFEKIYVSNKYRVKKHSGKLFDVVLEDLNVSPASILHIGDNYDADFKKAQTRGLKAFHIPHAYSLFRKTSAYDRVWLRDVRTHSLSWRMILSIVGNKFCDNSLLPQRKGTLFNGDLERCGYYCFGPMLLGFAKWLHEQAQRDRCEDLFFLSRDGKIMKEAYDLLTPLYKNAPKSHYLYCSRRAVNLARVETVKDITDLLSVDIHYKTKLHALLQHRFSVRAEEIPPTLLTKYGLKLDMEFAFIPFVKLNAFVLELKDLILHKAANERTVYMEYLNQAGIVAKNKLSIVDIGYNGTMQESLNEMFEGKKDIGGYYLITFRKILDRLMRNGLSSSAYLANAVDRQDTYHPFPRHVPLYETFFSGTETSLVRFVKSHDRTTIYPLFQEKTKHEASRSRKVGTLQKASLAFVNEVTSILGEELVNMDIEPNKTLRVPSNYFSAPHPRDAKLMLDIEFEDHYGGRGITRILPNNNDLNQQCLWPQGQQALKADYRKKNCQVIAVKAKNITPNLNLLRIENYIENYALSFKAKHQYISRLISPPWRIFRNYYYQTKEKYQQKRLTT